MLKLISDAYFTSAINDRRRTEDLPWNKFKPVDAQLLQLHGENNVLVIKSTDTQIIDTTAG